MKRVVRETALGRLELELERADRVEECVELALEAARIETRSFGRRAVLSGREVYLKGGPLRGGARLRHAARERVLREAPARLNETRNLRWLAEHDLPTVEPLAAGVLRRSGIASFQFLATAWLEGARALDTLWPEADSAARQDLVTHLARDVGRMHGLGFVHRDLFFRNLVVPPMAVPRAHLIDAWRGGPAHRWRGPAYDLACLMFDATAAWNDADQQHFFGAYFAERRLHDGAGDLEKLLTRARREHAHLARRVSRRGRAEPPRPWTPPPLAVPRQRKP